MKILIIKCTKIIIINCIKIIIINTNRMRRMILITHYLGVSSKVNVMSADKLKHNRAKIKT